MTRIRVGIDYLPAVSHAPGVGRYARELVRAAVLLEEDAELALFEWGVGERPMQGAPLGLDQARMALKRRQFRLPRRGLSLANRWLGLGADSLLGGVDVFHRVLPHDPPVRRAALVLPLVELPAEGCVADQRLGQAAREAAGIVVFCAHYAKEAARRYDVDPARITQVQVGCEHWLRDAPSAAPARSVPLILVLGALRGERRPLMALEGFEQLRAGGCQAELCFIGRPGSSAGAFRRRFAESPVANDVRWIETPIEADMPALVQSAAVLLHLAHDEGSPVTPLEACSLGPALALERLPAFEEALGSHASWIPRDPNAKQVAGALADALGSHQQAMHADVRRAHAATFSWRACAEQHLCIWRQAAAAPLLAP
ncbi:MAG: glycosyltransferase involved in cell wall biosynthesis [Planctomycetota bacterium]|jgi:glycosyltransferase involved in cell wall biosynthesis